MLSFNQYIIERTLNKGFEYEMKIHKTLKKAGLVPSNFNPAGASASAPDAMFEYQGKPYKLEVKLDTKADYGQVELRYENGKWRFGGKNEEAKELYTSLGVLDMINKEWKGKVPRKDTIPNKDFTWEDKQADFDTFKDLYIDVPVRALNSHYARKKTFYIQIGGAGFYHMDKDLAKIGTPPFNAKLRIRVRKKTRSSKKPYNYGFLTALQVVKAPSQSKFNIDKSVDFLL